MTGLLKGKTALVTGARRGIGMAVARCFASAGADVFACARKPDDAFEASLALLADEYGVVITPLYFDLDSHDQVREVSKSLVALKKPIDILVNNAGISINALLQMSTMESLEKQLSSNFVGPMLLTQYLSKIMGKYGGGNIINIASIAGMDGPMGRVGYGGSKAALICATKVLAKELAVKNIRVNAIAPGIIDTEMLAGNMTDAIIHETLQSTCLQRIGKPEEIAKVALFLASDLSSYVTGQVIRADGGKA